MLRKGEKKHFAIPQLQGQKMLNLLPKFSENWTRVHKLETPSPSLRRRQWHPTPVLLPGKSHGRRSLVGRRLWGRTELDTTEATAAAPPGTCKRRTRVSFTDYSKNQIHNFQECESAQYTHKGSAKNIRYWNPMTPLKIRLLQFNN